MVIIIKLINILTFVSDKPKILNVTSLQLIVLSFNIFSNSSLEMILELFFKVQSDDSSKKPCSIPE